jgi:translation initiation factor 2 beta subunit (eIF-2beta)/eIF-5
MKVTIPKSINDPFYRYWRPSLQIQNTKKNIRITNIFDVSKSINRSQVELIEWIKLKIKRNTKTENEQNKIILNIKQGKNQNNTDDKTPFDNILEEYITTYVICPSCNNPETTLDKFQKKLHMHCNACGIKNDLPINSKFYKYIVSTN